MKFLCDSCGTKYSIADERVRGRVLKIRCKKCDFVITVREDTGAAAVAVEPSAAAEVAKASDEAPSELEENTVFGELPPMPTTPNAGPGGDDWFLSFDGEQEGPFSLPRALERMHEEQGAGKESHAWRPGFLVWLPVEEVPELSGGGLNAKPQARPMFPVPVPMPSLGRSTGPVAAIAKDPSGPRAALSVSAGARPAVPVAALSPRPLPGTFPSASAAAPALANGPAPAIQSMFGGKQVQEDPPSLDDSALEPDGDDEDDDHEEGGPDLNISNEASGLVNLAHLAAAAMGQKPAGPIFMNGHTARAPKLDPEPLAALDPVESKSAPAPVVIVTAAAPSSASPLFKYITIAGVPILLLLLGTVGWLLTHRPTPDTIIVTEPSRHVDDSTITVNDPNVPRDPSFDPKHPGGRKGAAAAGIKATAPGPAQPGKPGTGLSGSQQALADLYKDGDDNAAPHGVPNVGGRHEQAGGQVSQSAIIAVVNVNKRQLSLCYERALKHDASLKSGRVPIQVTVGMSGRVTAVVIAEPQYASSELGQCFVQSVKRWSFPASDASYTTEFPFILQGQ